MKDLLFLVLLAAGCTDKGGPEGAGDSDGENTDTGEDTGESEVSPYANCSGVIEEDDDTDGSINSLWREEYDAGGNQTLDWVDEDNNGQPEKVTNWLYDADDRELFEEIDSNGDAVLDLASYRGYDADGTLERIEYDQDGDGDIDDVAIYFYNEQGLTDSVEYDVGNDGTVDRWIEAIYDEYGELEWVQETDAAGEILSTTTYTRSDGGQSVTVESDLNGDGYIDEVITYTLNEDGNYATFSLDSGQNLYSYAFYYNENGDRDKLVVEIYLDGGLYLTSVEQYSYDDAQRLDQILIDIYTPEDETTPYQTNTRYHTWMCPS